MEEDLLPWIKELIYIFFKNKFEIYFFIFNNDIYRNNFTKIWLKYFLPLNFLF